MTNEGQRLDGQIKDLERQLEQPIDSKRRREIQEAISHLKSKKHSWASPH